MTEFTNGKLAEFVIGWAHIMMGRGATPDDAFEAAREDAEKRFGVPVRLIPIYTLDDHSAVYTYGVSYHPELP